MKTTILLRLKTTQRAVTENLKDNKHKLEKQLNNNKSKQSSIANKDTGNISLHHLLLAACRIIIIIVFLCVVDVSVATILNHHWTQKAGLKVWNLWIWPVRLRIVLRLVVTCSPVLQISHLCPMNHSSTGPVS